MIISKNDLVCIQRIIHLRCSTGLLICLRLVSINFILFTPFFLSPDIFTYQLNFSVLWDLERTWRTMLTYTNFQAVDRLIPRVANERSEILVAHAYKNNWQKLHKKTFASPSRNCNEKEKKEKKKAKNKKSVTTEAFACWTASHKLALYQVYWP